MAAASKDGYMAAILLITLREGLEAALIVGIVLSVLQRLGKRGREGPVWVWGGVAGAVGASLGVALVLRTLGLALEGRAEELFEGLVMFLAAGVLTWMIFWMQRQGHQVERSLEGSARRAALSGSRWGLFALAFVAVVREGIETVLFLAAATKGTAPLMAFLAGAAGLGMAAALGWFIFVAGKRLNLRFFFRVTGTLLLLLAAGLLARGIHELQEASALPVLVEHLWDLNPILNEESLLGSLLAALFGYNGNPSLLEVVGYAAHLLLVGWLWIRGRPRAASARIAS